MVPSKILLPIAVLTLMFSLNSLFTQEKHHELQLSPSFVDVGDVVTFDLSFEIPEGAVIDFAQSTLKRQYTDYNPVDLFVYLRIKNFQDASQADIFKIDATDPIWQAKIESEFRSEASSKPKTITRNGVRLDQYRFKYELQIFDVFDIVLKDFTIVYYLDKQRYTLVFRAIPIYIKEYKIEADNETGIRDIKGPFAEGALVNWPLILLIALAALLIIILVILLIRYYKQPKFKSSNVLSTPYDIAVQELKELKESGIVESGEVKEFYFKLSQIVRRYLARQLKIFIMESTTSQVRNLLKARHIDTKRIQAIYDFLSNADLVKFAKESKTSEDSDDDFGKGFTIVNMFYTPTGDNKSLATLE